MLVCPLCRIALGPHDAVCPRDGHLGQEASWNAVPVTLEKRFTLIAPFAHGPTGSTYLADEPETGRRGLLKVMAPAGRTQAAERQRMRRELLKQATMTAQHLALPFATGETEGTLWLFRESIEGEALGVHLANSGALPESEALRIAAQLASALDDLHRAGLLHRDVKPGHLLIARDDTGGMRAVLIDSGVCRPLDSEGTSAVFGTPGYVAPEQLAGKLVSFRSDLYALGCVLYEMLTGRAPFAREDMASTLAAQAVGDVPALPPEISAPVAVLVRSLLAKDPQDRPFSAQKLRRALDPFLPHGATVNRHPSLTKPPVPPAGSRIPSAPSEGAPRPSSKTSMPPPPPARRSTADATQQVQLEQIVDIAPSMKAKSVAPPPPAAAMRSAESEAARKRDATEPVELDQVLGVSAAPAPAPEPPKSYRPNADHTQPIRLDQILAVAEQRKKTLSVPPAHAPEPAAPAVQAPAPVAVAQVQAEADSSDEALPSIELTLPDEAPSAVPASTVPAASVAQHDATIVDAMGLDQEIADEEHDEPATDNSVTVVAERPSPDSRGAHATLVGIGRVAAPPEAGTVARGSEAPPALFAVDTPQHVDVHGAGDSAQHTLPHNPAAAIAKAKRMDAERHRDGDEIKLPMRGEGSRKYVYAAAAVALLGLLGVGASKLFGSETPAVAEQDKTPETLTGTAMAKEPAAPVMPLAEAPKAEPTPTITKIVEAQPQPIAPAPAAQAPAVAAAPAVVPVEKPAPKAAEPERSTRRERSEKRAPSVNKEELWAQARDEARAHYAAKRYKQAAQAYEQASKYSPSNAGTYAGLGGARLQLGDTRGAIQAYSKAVQLSPSTSGFHAALGRAYLTAGDKAKARASYKRALALDPNNEAAKTVLATL